ncbi:nucleotidyl transferase AbiEii/AbiGii toxin family protein [Candidatus Peregrinibacteria bacterium]|nr:nucleotidyl transferase AbiEii/AbiGii toxin family protein [Candidatus Peregrinibacteria bacterium]
MFLKILDKKRSNILPLFESFKKDFYLAGGTALALQIGHRDSIDFDFFSKKSIDTNKLFANLKEIFKNHQILKVHEEKNTLTVIIEKDIKLSFLTYPYTLIDKLIETENFKMASIREIGCMKLSAITGRATLKDYIDLYFILEKIKLAELLSLAQKKFPDLDTNLILKSLVYFEDLEKGPIKFENNNKINIKEIKKFFEKKVKSYLLLGE